MSSSNKRPRTDSDEKECVLYSCNDEHVTSGLIEIHDLPEEVLLLVINMLFSKTAKGLSCIIKIETEDIVIDDLFEKEELVLLKYFAECEKLDTNGNVDQIKENIEIAKKSDKFNEFIKTKMEEDGVKEKHEMVEMIAEEMRDKVFDDLNEFVYKPEISTVSFPSTVKIVGQIVTYVPDKYL